MALTGSWKFDGDKTDLQVFSKRFKIQRGKVPATTQSASEETCFGFLCYEKSRSFGLISEIVAPLLTLPMATAAVEIMERDFPEGDWSNWEQLEIELRKRGYNGQTLCPYSLPDAIGYFIMKTIGEYTVTQLEDAPEGFIEDYLTARGYVWLAEERTWQNNKKEIWNERKKVWQAQH